MPFSFPPCPVCGGTQAFFYEVSSDESVRISLGSGGLFGGAIRLGVVICLKCGHTEPHPHPRDMARLRAAAEKRGPLPD
jgi:hypothetical protein